MRGLTWVLVAVVALVGGIAWSASVVLRTEAADGVVTERQSLSGVNGGIRTKVAFEHEGSDHIGSVDGYAEYEVGDEVVVFFAVPWTGDDLPERVDVVFDQWELWLVPVLVTGALIVWFGFEIYRYRRARAKG